MCKSDSVAGSVDGTFDIVVVGSANLDLVADVGDLPRPGQTVTAVSYAEHAGGKGLNQAVACARMGARVAFVGCVGDDAAGLFLRAVLEDEGIDVTRLRVSGLPTGRAFIAVDRAGENSIVVVPGANATVGVGHDIDIPPCGLVLAQLEIPLGTVAALMSRARGMGARTVLNPAPAAVLSDELISECDVIAPNETEAAVLGGAGNLLARGSGAVVLTLGARGARVMTAGSTTDIPAYPVTPVDTVGAGDAFVGAMCAELVRGAPLEDACRVAAVAGALATTVRGAVPGLPSLEKVLRAQAEG